MLRIFYSRVILMPENELKTKAEEISDLVEGAVHGVKSILTEMVENVRYFPKVAVVDKTGKGCTYVKGLQLFSEEEIKPKQPPTSLGIRITGKPRIVMFPEGLYFCQLKWYGSERVGSFVDQLSAIDMTTREECKTEYLQYGRLVAEKISALAGCK